MVERWTSEQKSGFETYLRGDVSLSMTLYSQKILVIPRKQWHRLDMTEKLLTGTLSLNTYKQTNKQTNKQTKSLLISIMEF